MRDDSNRHCAPSSNALYRQFADEIERRQQAALIRRQFKQQRDFKRRELEYLQQVVEAYEREQHDTTRKRISLTRVLECFREMGHTEEELEMERIMMYADAMYRRRWTDGQWTMLSESYC